MMTWWWLFCRRVAVPMRYLLWRYTGWLRSFLCLRLPCYLSFSCPGSGWCHRKSSASTTSRWVSQILTMINARTLNRYYIVGPCSHWQIRIIRGEQKVHDFTACPLLVVGARSDWTEVALFPPVLPELAAWERCTHRKNHVNIKRDFHFQTWNQT